MNKASDPKIPKKQQDIIATAEYLFKRYGIKRVTVEELCQKANASKMTFYKYFSNKTDLVEYIWGRWVELQLDKIDEVDALDIPFPEKLERLWQYKVEFISQMTVESIEEFLDLNIVKGKIMQRFLQFIADAQKRGEIRPEIRPKFFLALADAMYELARNEELVKEYPDFASFNRELFNVFYYGVLANSH